MLTAVIPLLNEADSLPSLYEELAAVAASQSEPWEILFVDDGSTDDSWAVVSRLADADPRCAGWAAAQFGKAAALAAGFKAARGGTLVTLDADGQDDPHEIPRMVAMLDQGYDLVSGWKQDRQDPWHKVLLSRVFNSTVSWMTGVKLNDHNCGLKCYRQ